MHLSTMNDWLSWISSIHIKEIELGLERIKRVAQRINVLCFDCPIIIVGGTNGKGSTIAGLEAIYLAAGYRVAAFTSPFIFKYNEQVRLNGQEATDADFCLAFEKIEAARGKDTLTPFEFHTLAALYIFKQKPVDILLLEVGLGGRLDAVNIIDADISIVTSIDIDHVEWLGSTKEKIAYEKAGIFRSGKPAICGEANPPETLKQHALQIGAHLFCQEQDFCYRIHDSDWSFFYKKTALCQLPLTNLAIENMSLVLMAITLMQDKLPVTHKAITIGLGKVALIGRIQIIDNYPVTLIYDVSHNPAAVRLLANYLSAMSCQGKTYAVFSMLGDKDIISSINAIKDLIDYWYVAPLSVKRAASFQQLQHAFIDTDIKNISYQQAITESFEQAKQNAKDGDRIIIFGSFHTLAEVMREF